MAVPALPIEDYFTDEDYLPPRSPGLQPVKINFSDIAGIGGKKRERSYELNADGDDELDLVGVLHSNIPLKDRKSRATRLHVSSGTACTTAPPPALRRSARIAAKTARLQAALTQAASAPQPASAAQRGPTSQRTGARPRSTACKATRAPTPPVSDRKKRRE